MNSVVILQILHWKLVWTFECFLDLVCSASRVQIDLSSYCGGPHVFHDQFATVSLSFHEASIRLLSISRSTGLAASPHVDTTCRIVFCAVHQAPASNYTEQDDSRWWTHASSTSVKRDLSMRVISSTPCGQQIRKWSKRQRDRKREGALEICSHTWHPTCVYLHVYDNTCTCVHTYKYMHIYYILLQLNIMSRL